MRAWGRPPQLAEGRLGERNAEEHSRLADDGTLNRAFVGLDERSVTRATTAAPSATAAASAGSRPGAGARPARPRIVATGAEHQQEAQRTQDASIHGLVGTVSRARAQQGYAAHGHCLS